MKEKTMVVRNRLGLHARPAALFVQTSARFRSEVQVTKSVDGENVTVNGKSVMGLMMLAAACGDKVSVKIQGPDEAQAMAQIEKLFDGKFGEDA